MSRSKSMLAVAASAAILAPAATGSVVPTVPNGNIIWPIPHTQAALRDDANMSNYCTFDIQVVISGTGSIVGAPGSGDRWISTDLRAILVSGTFYIPPKKTGGGVDSDKPQANAGFWGIVPGGRLEDDVFVT